MNAPVDESRATSDPRLARALSGLLRYGLMLAVALMLVGVILSVARPGLDVDRATSLTGIPGALASLHPDGFFNLGLLVLLATPAARVIGLLIAFLRRRTWLFAGAAVLVLVVLVASGYLGLRGV